MKHENRKQITEWLERAIETVASLRGVPPEEAEELVVASVGNLYAGFLTITGKLPSELLQVSSTPVYEALHKLMSSEYSNPGLRASALANLWSQVGVWHDESAHFAERFRRFPSRRRVHLNTRDIYRMICTLLGELAKVAESQVPDKMYPPHPEEHENPPPPEGSRVWRYETTIKREKETP